MKQVQIFLVKKWNKYKFERTYLLSPFSWITTAPWQQRKWDRCVHITEGKGEGWERGDHREVEGEGPLHLHPLRGPRVRTGERNGGLKCHQGNFYLQANDLPVAYLCGQEPYCMKIGDRRALRQAKRNVEQSFPVVGVLEELSKKKFKPEPTPK